MGLRFFLIVGLAFSLVCCGESASTNSVEDSQINVGESLYTKYCISCHGVDGKLGASGSSDLSVSIKNDEETKEIIKKGGKGMPQFEALISDNEIDLLLEHVISMRE